MNIIIDSHIHLYAESHLPTLAWAGPSAPDVLTRQNSVEQYKAASIKERPRGFVFVETDRKSALTEDSWDYALEEVNFLRRIKAGKPVEGEGHVAEDRNLILGAVIWAPLGAPTELLKRYLERSGAIQDLKAKDGLVRGFRYLLQDKPKGTALQPAFIEGLLLLEQAGAKTFDLGVDFRQGGHWQLVETISMLETFSSRSTGSMKFVINHFCKPDLRISGPEAESALQKWKDCIDRLAKFHTYMKLSGFFSELPPQEAGKPASITELLKRTRPYVKVVFDSFGPSSGTGKSRVLFGSDWPVCNIGGPGVEQSWQHWVAFVDAVLEDQQLSRDEKAEVWAGCACEVYDLNVE